MRKIIYIIFSVFLFSFYVLLKNSFAEKTQNQDYARVIIFDVGQGDGILVQTSFGQDILIDGGSNEIILEKLNQNMSFENRDIELAVLTHNHDDHFGGLLKIVEQDDFKIKKLLFSNKTCESAGCEEFFKLAGEKNIEMVQAKSGMKIDLFCVENADCYWMDILGPADKFSNDKNLNNTSIIIKAHLPRKDFLFTGDTEEKIWNYYTDKFESGFYSDNFLDVDILKVAHHGSRNGTTEDLLKLTTPEEAVISCGRNNKFGHPHSEALKLLDSFGTNIRRTDLEGDIRY